MLATRMAAPTKSSGEWHEMPAAEVLDKLTTSLEEGLTEESVQLRREQYGRNVLTPPRSNGLLIRLLLQFHQPLVYILLSAAVVTLALEEFVDSGVIPGVVVVNALIGFLQESKALKAIEALARTMSAEATVLRGSRTLRVAAAEVVPGDVLLLQPGEKVAADSRLIRSRELQVDESALTAFNPKSGSVASFLKRVWPKTPSMRNVADAV